MDVPLTEWLIIGLVAAAAIFVVVIAALKNFTRKGVMFAALVLSVAAFLLFIFRG
jgi:hypothetical protein